LIIILLTKHTGGGCKNIIDLYLIMKTRCSYIQGAEEYNDCERIQGWEMKTGREKEGNERPWKREMLTNGRVERNAVEQ